MKEQIIIEREVENNSIRNYLERNNDEQRLKDYYEYGINDFTNLITIERLLQEYEICIEVEDNELKEKLEVIIDYLLDCSIG